MIPARYRAARAAERQDLHSRFDRLIAPARAGGCIVRAASARVDETLVRDHRPASTAWCPACGVAVLEVVAEYVARDGTSRPATGASGTASPTGTASAAGSAASPTGAASAAGTAPATRSVRPRSAVGARASRTAARSARTTATVCTGAAARTRAPSRSAGGSAGCPTSARGTARTGAAAAGASAGCYRGITRSAVGSCCAHTASACADTERAAGAEVARGAACSVTGVRATAAIAGPSRRFGVLRGCAAS